MKKPIRTKDTKLLIGNELCELENILYDYYARLQIEAEKTLFPLLSPKNILEDWQKPNLFKKSQIICLEVSSNNIIMKLASANKPSDMVAVSLPIKDQNQKKFAYRFEAVRTLKKNVNQINNYLMKQDASKERAYTRFKSIAAPLFKTINENQPSWWEKPLLKKLEDISEMIITTITIIPLLVSSIVSTLFPNPYQRLCKFQKNKENIQTYAALHPSKIP